MTTLSQKFWALVAREGDDKKIVATVEQADDSFLADGDVLVRVAHSTINYKDALAVCNRGKILRASPIIPGVDYAGEVVASDGEFAPGDFVILTGNAVGEKYSGGFGEYARAKSAWLLPLPSNLDTRQAMICGTAGLTAALCVLALTDGGRLKPGGRVAVSGASGGVGSFAVTLLARLGYAVSAISRTAATDYLRQMGADEIIPRETMSADCKPLEKSRWDGALDTVGGKVLARLLAETNYGGVVAACGLAGGATLATTVMPFILRGVRLDGVDSVMIPHPLRRRAWQLIADTLAAADYEHIAAGQVGLAGIVDAAEKVLDGNINGRFIVVPRNE